MKKMNLLNSEEAKNVYAGRPVCPPKFLVPICKYDDVIPPCSATYTIPCGTWDTIPPCVTDVKPCTSKYFIQPCKYDIILCKSHDGIEI